MPFLLREHASSICPIWLLIALVWTASASAAPPLEGLDLRTTTMVVVGPEPHVAILRDRAQALFAAAGLPALPAEPTEGRAKATLTLALDAQPLGGVCPNHVLYRPALSLTEPVVIARNGVAMSDISWELHAGRQVRASVSPDDLLADLERFLGQFIADFLVANRNIPKTGAGQSGLDRSTDDSRLSPPLHVSPQDTVQGGVVGLWTERLVVQALAGEHSRSLENRAIRQLTTAGLSASVPSGAAAPLTLSIELVQQSLYDRCPGLVLYEAGLFLVEEVQIRRNPRVVIWSDTWTREQARVVPPATRAQLEADQDALLEQFIRSVRISQKQP